MSYDGWLMIDAGGSEPVEIAELGNYTSNVSPMWRRALTAAGEEIPLSGTEGWNAGETLPLLTLAISHMREHPDEYRAMNPPNGWGSYEGALEYLVGVAKACERHPKAHLHWWV